MPALGRMRLWESFSPMNNDSVTEILKTMRHSLLAVPFLPAAALAADLQTKAGAAGKVGETGA